MTLHGGQQGCVRERQQTDLHLEVSVDVRCLPWLPLNVTCFSISETYPHNTQWPYGYGTFKPLDGCSGVDPDLLDAICTLRCAVGRSGSRHAEMFCAFELGKSQKYQLRERSVHLDFCDFTSACISPLREESKLVCYSGVPSPLSTAATTYMLSFIDGRTLLLLGLVVSLLACRCDRGVPGCWLV